MMTFYILLFNPQLDCRSIKIILPMSAANRPLGVASKWHRVKVQFLSHFFPFRSHPLGVSEGSSRSAGVSCLPPCALWWQFALGHEARLGCVEGAKGLRRSREVALSCSLWPKHNMNASGVRLCSWAKECPQWLPSGTLLSVQFRMLAGLPSGQGLGHRWQEAHKDLPAHLFLKVKQVSSQWKLKPWLHHCWSGCFAEHHLHPGCWNNIVTRSTPVH